MAISLPKIKARGRGNYRRVRLECLKNFPDNFGSGYTDEAAIPRLKFEKFIEDEAVNDFMFGAFNEEDLIGLAGLSRADRTKTRHRAESCRCMSIRNFAGEKSAKRCSLN